MQTVTKTQKKLVFLSTEVPADCVRMAQVAILSDDSWHLIAPWPHRAHGLSRSIPMPEVTCPIVDVSAVKDDLRMREIFNRYVAPYAGVINLSGLLSGLEGLGAKVLNNKRIAKKVQ